MIIPMQKIDRNNLPTIIVFEGRFMVALVSRYALVSFNKKTKEGTAYHNNIKKDEIIADFLENTSFDLNNYKDIKWFYYEDISKFQEFGLINSGCYLDRDLDLYEKSQEDDDRPNYTMVPE